MKREARSVNEDQRGNASGTRRRRIEERGEREREKGRGGKRERERKGEDICIVYTRTSTMRKGERKE